MKLIEASFITISSPIAIKESSSGIFTFILVPPRDCAYVVPKCPVPLICEAMAPEGVVSKRLILADEEPNGKTLVRESS